MQSSRKNWLVTYGVKRAGDTFAGQAGSVGREVAFVGENCKWNHDVPAGEYVLERRGAATGRWDASTGGFRGLRGELRHRWIPRRRRPVRSLPGAAARCKQQVPPGRRRRRRRWRRRDERECRRRRAMVDRKTRRRSAGRTSWRTGQDRLVFDGIEKCSKRMKRGERRVFIYYYTDFLVLIKSIGWHTDLALFFN